MDAIHRTVLMERSSILPTNICPESGLPLKPPELLRSKPIGNSVKNKEELIEWLQENLASYHSSHISARGDSIMVACEVESIFFDESLTLIDSWTEDAVDTIFRESLHCTYDKVWRVSALKGLYSRDDIRWMTQPRGCCSRLISFLKCQRTNLKIYIIDLVV